jgi:hypothetical protein
MAKGDPVFLPPPKDMDGIQVPVKKPSLAPPPTVGGIGAEGGLGLSRSSNPVVEYMKNQVRETPDFLKQQYETYAGDTPTFQAPQGFGMDAAASGALANRMKEIYANKLNMNKAAFLRQVPLAWSDRQQKQNAISEGQLDMDRAADAAHAAKKAAKAAKNKALMSAILGVGGAAAGAAIGGPAGAQVGAGLGTTAGSQM